MIVTIISSGQQLKFNIRGSRGAIQGRIEEGGLAILISMLTALKSELLFSIALISELLYSIAL